MIGLVSYRDYFSNGFVKKQKSLKSEALHQYRLDAQEILGEEIEVAATKDARDADFLSKYSAVVVFDHPMSSISQKKHVGFTTPNLHHHAAILRHLANFEGKKYLISYERKNFDYWLSSYSGRLKKTSIVQGEVVSWPKLEIVERVFDGLIDITAEFDRVRGDRKRAVFGDSHASLFWRPGSTCYSLFGQTLYRVLENGLNTLYSSKLDEVTLNFGNIDLRYHLARQDDPEQATRDLATRYLEQARKLDAHVRIAALLPVTVEIPGIMKSYLYKKEQYFGTFDERKKLKNIFLETLLSQERGKKIEVLLPPPEFETSDGFMNESVREVRGVHVCPSKYEYCLTSGSSERRPEFSWQVA
jgi:hypothetical protein